MFFLHLLFCIVLSVRLFFDFIYCTQIYCVNMLITVANKYSSSQLELFYRVYHVSTDVTIIEIEIEIVFLTEYRIESKSYFSCIPSKDLSIEALDRLLTPSCFNASTDRPHTLQRGRSSVIKLFICRRRLPLSWSEREVTGEGRTGVVPGQTRPTYRYRPIIT